MTINGMKKHSIVAMKRFGSKKKKGKGKNHFSESSIKIAMILVPLEREGGQK